MSGYTKHKKDFELDGVTLSQFLDRLDYTLQTEEERVTLVDNMMYKTLINENGEKIKILNDYIVEAVTGESGGQNYVNVCLNKADSLSEDVTFFKLVEVMSNYIINSPNASDLYKTTQYNFYNNEQQFQKKLDRESMPRLSAHIDGANITQEEIIDFLLTKRPNYKRSKKQTITKQDIDNIELVGIYQDAINKSQIKRNDLKELVKLIDMNIENLDEDEDNEITKHLRKQKNNTKKEIREINNMIGSMVDDQLFCKQSSLCTIYFKNPLPDSMSSPDWSKFSFFEQEHVYALLFLSRDHEYLDERENLVKELQKYINSCDLTKTQLYILENMSRNRKLVDIAYQLTMSKQSLHKKIQAIVIKLMEAHEKHYIDWYYTYVEKGTYKECTNCGRNKIVQQFHKNMDVCDDCTKHATKKCKSCGYEFPLSDFTINSRNSDGLEKICKLCNSEVNNS